MRERTTGALAAALDWAMLLLLIVASLLRLARHNQLIARGLVAPHSWRGLPHGHLLSSLEYVGNFCSLVGTTITFSLRPTLVWYSLVLSCADAAESQTMQAPQARPYGSFDSAHNAVASQPRSAALAVFVAYCFLKLLSELSLPLKPLGVFLSHAGWLLAAAAAFLHYRSTASGAQLAATRVPVRDRTTMRWMLFEKVSALASAGLYLAIVAREGRWQLPTGHAVPLRWYASTVATVVVEGAVVVGLVYRLQRVADCVDRHIAV